MIDKSREHGLKGQNISAQGNALGKTGKMKTVRDKKIKDAQNFFRTELLNNNFETIQSFRPQLQLHIVQGYRADDFNNTHITQGVALGWNIYPFQGKKNYINPYKIYSGLK